MALNLPFYTHNFLTCRSNTELVDPRWILIPDARATRECIYSQAFPPEYPHHEEGHQNHAFVVFEAVGRIRQEDCYLTTTGDAVTGDPEADKEPYAYCWLEAPMDTGPLKDEWQRLMARLNNIIHSVDEEFLTQANTEFLFDGIDDADASADGRGPSVPQFLQVNFRLHHPTTQYRGNMLPLFHVDGAQFVPTSVEDIPFESLVRVFFSLIIWPPPTGGLSVAASIQSMHFI